MPGALQKMPDIFGDIIFLSATFWKYLEEKC